MHRIPEKHTVRGCYERVNTLYRQIIEADVPWQVQIDSCPPDYRESARNLMQYLALRRHDIRQLQIDLARLGLSSLGRLEAHVQAGLESVLKALRHLTSDELPYSELSQAVISFEEGDARLARHTEHLLGPHPPDRSVRIMVTLPTDAATDFTLVRNLVRAGMNIARINCAHDNPSAWTQMIANVQQAAKECGQCCRVLMDLAGPKLRTGALESGPRVRKFRPQRDQRGRVLHPALCLLYAGDPPDDQMTQLLPVNQELIDDLRVGDRIRLRDARGKSRKLEVNEAVGSGFLAACDQTVYMESGLALKHRRKGKTVGHGKVGMLPPLETWITLHVGDVLILTPPDEAGGPAQLDDEGRVLKPARIPCTLPEIFPDIKPGAAIFFDDGKIGGRVVNAAPEALQIRITSARENGSKLRSDKGINLPDSSLNIPALTEQDLEHLDFAVKHSDMIGLSFVKSPEDVELLHREIEKRTDKSIGVVLKIETRQGFEQLPGLLLSGLQKPPLGVMVARGDLGVEVGFERMAEVQEEILWLCEAAHISVIWATQVLEQLNKRGQASRGEITDAAMSTRAECVMLNKGTHVVQTVLFLEDIILRMQDHHSKKTPMLRKLKVSEGRW